MSDDSPENRLNRTLGLPAALSVGVGTMLGAGIFVFPGLAANEAGPAGMLSFAIGGVIALLVALCTAELATAMPRSGGAYFHVSRSFGRFAGFLVGLSQSVGLIFASAFYLVAFADYALNLFGGAGSSAAVMTILLAVGAALVLTLVNVIGSGEAGRLQSLIVVVLSALLLVLLCAGVLRATGVSGEPLPSPEFAPFGTMPIFTTAAFVFTSYLGFVQISTVAGEVIRPARTLPLALIGSVVLVSVMYVVTMYVTTYVISADDLKETGSESIIELGRRLFGGMGGTLVLFAGLLATLSSANASILSSSRTLFALGQDELLPPRVARVSERFGSPVLAIVIVGIAVAALTFVGSLRLLAEVSSALHLVIYALICAALLRQRFSPLPDYGAPFRVPAARLVATIGATACIGLLFFMQPLALLIGAGVVAAAVLWYAAHRRLNSGSA